MIHHLDHILEILFLPAVLAIPNTRTMSAHSPGMPLGNQDTFGDPFHHGD